jgi:DNA replication ATP-dependent helicase Dna2
MNILSSETAILLYDRIFEIHQLQDISPKERISYIRACLERLFVHLTKEEVQTFSGLHARALFICDKFQLEIEIQENIHGLRKLANKALFKANYTPVYDDYLLSVNALCKIIHAFSDVSIPEEIAKIVENVSLFFEKSNKDTKNIIPFVKAIIIDIQPAKDAANGRKYCVLTCEEEGEMGKFSIMLWDKPKPQGETLGGKLSSVAGLAWKYAEIHLLNIEKMAGKEDTYTSNLDTLAIIDPNYLIDATEIAECFMTWQHARMSNPNLYLLRKLMSSEGSLTAPLRGQIAGEVLNQFIINPKQTVTEAKLQYEEVFAQAITDNAIRCARIGRERIIKEIKEPLEQLHLKNIYNISQAYSGKETTIEPTFFSALYGLQGRLDAMMEHNVETSAFSRTKTTHTFDENRKDVFELKSGKPPMQDVLENNRMQVVVYNLLLRSVFGEKRTGTSSIFYSQKILDPLINVANFTQLEQEVLMVRNCIVAMDYHLAKGNHKVLNRITAKNFGARSQFQDTDIITFEEIYNQASETEKAYFHSFLSFIFRELRTAKVGTEGDSEERSDGFSALWKQPDLGSKQNNFTILNDLEFEPTHIPSKEIILTKAEMTFRKTAETSKVTNFREGDIAIIYPQDGKELRPLNYQILKGTVTKIEKDFIRISLRNKQLNISYFSKYSRWAIEHDFLESSFNAQYQSLFDFLRAMPNKRDLLLGLNQPKKGAEVDVRNHEGISKLNSNQQLILQKALSAKDYFLLQGPPGTGKTSYMLVHIAKYLLQQEQEDMVIVAFTNRAVSEICEKLAKNNLPFIRITSGESSDSHALSNQIAGKRIDEVADVIVSHKIFVSTVQSFLTKRNDICDIKKFGTIIVDEASQLLEPHLIGLLCQFKKFILIGDHNQLPAVVTQKEKDCFTKDKLLNEIEIKDLRVSLFERLWKRCEKMGWNHAFAMLEFHYRMHEEIADWINPFYFNKLKAGISRQKSKEQLFSSHSKDPIEAHLAKSRTVFFASKPSRETKSNEEEAEKVVRILETIRRVYGKDFSATTVGVITPWRAQISKIVQKITDEELLQKVTIDTVERFQGSEREVIIISFAMSHTQQMDMIQSLTEAGNVDRKFNVAVSRAQQHLILLGCPQILSRSEHYEKLLNTLKKNGGYVAHL